jgi:putative transcriptional regulator
VIHVKLLELLGSRGKSQYWLAKETGMSPITIASLCKGKAKGVNFSTLNSICKALDCQPNDVLVHVPDHKGKEKR